MPSINTNTIYTNHQELNYNNSNQNQITIIHMWVPPGHTPPFATLDKSIATTFAYSVALIFFFQYFLKT